MLHEVKFGGRASWLKIFKRYCGWPEGPPWEDAAVVPVPMHPSRLWERGFNQSFELGRWLSEHQRLPFLPDSLLKVRDTAAQSSLSRVKRLKNTAGAFRWRGSVPAQIVLVDDVWTTGSTMEACAVALKDAGVKKVFAWTLFRTPLR